MSNIGVFGGSFDPPHLGHKALVEAALLELELDGVWVLPVGVPVHRELTSSISAKQRLLWVEKMFAGMEGVEVFDWEVQSVKPTPSIELMYRLGKDLPNVPVWLMGMDAWLGLPHWIAYPEHAQWCNMAVFSRADEKFKLHTDWQVVDTLSNMQTGQVCIAKSNLPDVSASQIRQAILAGNDVSKMLDVSIADDIQTAYMDKSSNGVNE